jgi:hypothetical protein
VYWLRIVLWLFIVTSCNSSINSISKLNPVPLFWGDNFHLRQTKLRETSVRLTVNNNTFCFATIDKVFYYVASVLTTCFGFYHPFILNSNLYASALRPPLWSSGQSCWLQIRRPGFDSRHYQEKKKSSGSGTGSTQPREFTWGATW